MQRAVLSSLRDLECCGYMLFLILSSQASCDYWPITGQVISACLETMFHTSFFSFGLLVALLLAERLLTCVPLHCGVKYCNKILPIPPISMNYMQSMKLLKAATLLLLVPPVFLFPSFATLYFSIKYFILFILFLMVLLHFMQGLNLSQIFFHAVLDSQLFRHLWLSAHSWTGNFCSSWDHVSYFFFSFGFLVVLLLLASSFAIKGDCSILATEDYLPNAICLYFQ